MVKQIGKTFLGESQTVEKSVKKVWWKNCGGKMIVKENFMEIRSMMIPDWSLEVMLGHS